MKATITSPAYSYNVTYTNNRVRPILVVCRVTLDNSAPGDAVDFDGKAGAVTISTLNHNIVGIIMGTVIWIVPPGMTYQLTRTLTGGGMGTLQQWTEAAL